MSEPTQAALTLARLDLGLPVRDIESLRLQHDDRGISIVVATTETLGRSSYRTVIHEARRGALPVRRFEVRQLLPAPCSWDLAPGPAVILDPHLGATRELRRIADRDPAVLSHKYPAQSFSRPRVARGASLITAVVDGQTLVAFDDNAEQYRTLTPAIAGLVVRVAGIPQLFYLAPVAAPYRGDNLPPGALYVVADPPAGPPTHAVDAPVFELDADADDRVVVVAGTRLTTLTVLISSVHAPATPVFQLTSPEGLWSSPSVLIVNGRAHIAVLAVTTDGERGVYYAALTL